MPEAIDRIALRMKLGLPERIPADYTAYFTAVECPTWYWRALRQHPLDAERWLANPQIAVIADVIVKVSKRWMRNGKWIKTSKHRVFVVCPNCEREIPAGRWHQHVGSETCAKS